MKKFKKQVAHAKWNDFIGLYVKESNKYHKHKTKKQHKRFKLVRTELISRTITNYCYELRKGKWIDLRKEQ